MIIKLFRHTLLAAVLVGLGAVTWQASREKVTLVAASQALTGRALIDVAGEAEDDS